MKRNGIIVLLLVVGLGLMIWAGIENYTARQKEMTKIQALEAELSAAEGQTNGSNGGAASGADNSFAPESPLLNEQAPNFTLTSIDGKKISLASYRGKALIVDFWATWCGPCRMEIPWFISLKKQYAGKGLAVVGIATDAVDDGNPQQATKTIQNFATKMQMNYPVLLATNAVQQAYGGIDSLPTTFYINRKGVVVASTVGVPPHDVVVANIQKALSSGSGSTGGAA